MSHPSPKRHTRSPARPRPVWLTIVTIALACILSFFLVLAYLVPGQQAVYTLRFALGWHHIAWHQQQFSQILMLSLAKLSLASNAYHKEGASFQRRGREHWQQQTHKIQIPPTLSLPTCEVVLREALSFLPYTILERHLRSDTGFVTIELLFGMVGVATDLLVLTQPRVEATTRAAIPARHAPPHLASPLASTLPASPLSNTKLPTPALQARPLQGRTRAQIAIIIDDLGWDLTVARMLLGLDEPLSFAILPHTPHQVLIAQEAQRRGRDILLHLPMEPHHYPQIDPGKTALLSTMPPQQLVARVEEALAAVPAVIGVNNHMGSRLTENRDAMRVVMQLLKQHNLFFLDSRTSQKSLAYHIAREFGVPTTQRQIFLDHNTDSTQIQRQLSSLVALAQTHGSAIGIGHPYLVTVQALQHFLPELRQASVEVVPVSRLVR